MKKNIPLSNGKLLFQWNTNFSRRYRNIIWSNVSKDAGKKWNKEIYNKYNTTSPRNSFEVMPYASHHKNHIVPKSHSSQITFPIIESSSAGLCQKKAEQYRWLTGIIPVWLASFFLMAEKFSILLLGQENKCHADERSPAAVRADAGCRRKIGIWREFSMPPICLRK